MAAETPVELVTGVEVPVELMTSGRGASGIDDRRGTGGADDC